MENTNSTHEKADTQKGDSGESAREVIRLRGVEFGFPGAWKLGPLDVSLRKGEIWGMVGPNGAGKTTLMETILGFNPPLTGEVTIQPDANRPAGVSYVPQRETLASVFPVSALQVVLMGLAPVRGLGRPFRNSDKDRAMEALKSVGMERLALQPFRSLSGGEQQRTLLGRALVGNPSVLMLDEPTAGMDVDAGRRILHLITGLASAGGQSVLMISHMLDDIRSHTHQVIYVHRLKGFVRTGRPSEVISESDGTPTFEKDSESA